MGLPTYDCPTELPASIPRIMEQHGITAETVELPEDGRGPRYGFGLRRRTATVLVHCWQESGVGHSTLIMVCDRKPLFKSLLSDMKLMNEVEAILLAQGARHAYGDTEPE